MTGLTAERLVRDSKTGMGGSVHRGFESVPLRWVKVARQAAGEVALRQPASTVSRAT